MNSQVTLIHFGQLFDQALGQYVVNSLGILIGYLVPIAVTLVTIWVLLYGYATVRNETGDSISTFAGEALRIAVILAVALTTNVYMNWVVGSANDLMNFLSGLFLQAAGLSNPAATTWSLIDAYDAQVEAVVVTLGKDVVQIAPPFINFPNLFAIVLISLGGCFFEVCMLAVTCFAKVILTLALSIGPIFILTLLFTPTSHFFEAWLSKLLSAILLSAITFFLAGLSLSITGSFLTSFLAEVSTINFIVAGMVVGVIEFLLGIVMIQAPILAASLSRGATFHSGRATVSALFAGRAFRAGRSSVVPGAGGSSAGPTSGSYGARTWARSAQAAASAARRVAYKLASMRGRS